MGLYNFASGNKEMSLLFKYKGQKEREINLFSKEYEVG